MVLKKTILSMVILSVLTSACSIVRTTADVVKTTAEVTGTVVGTTAKVAGTAVSTSVDVAKAGISAGAVAGSAAVSAASAAKTVTLATASVAISGVSLVGNMVMWGINMKKQDEYHAAPVVASGGGRFISAEGKILGTDCVSVAPQTPGTLIYTKSGETLVRVKGDACDVKSVS